MKNPGPMHLVDATAPAPDDAVEVVPAASEGVTLDDFRSYMPMHSYIFTPTGEMWPASSVNARVPPVPGTPKSIPASAWLDEHRAVEQMTWDPGRPPLVVDHLISE